MNKWTVIYLPEVYNDISRLDKNVKETLYRSLRKVSQNPLPYTEGGYGKPLSNLKGVELAGMLKIKLRSSGVRVVYTLKRTGSEMLVVVVGLRDDAQVYKDAAKRKKKYGL